jgi:hypothetical protein
MAPATMRASSDHAAGLEASTGTGMYRPRRARRSHPSAAHRDSFLAAVSGSTPSASTTVAGVTNRRPDPRTAARSARPDELMPARSSGMGGSKRSIASLRSGRWTGLRRGGGRSSFSNKDSRGLDPVLGSDGSGPFRLLSPRYRRGPRAARTGFAGSEPSNMFLTLQGESQRFTGMSPEDAGLKWGQ